MWYKFWQYLVYKRKARNEYSLHSPFMFTLYNEVFKKARKKNTLYRPIEKARRDLLHNHNIVTVEDFGAGSKKKAGPQRKISSITRHTSKKPRYARFISLLAQYLEHKKIVELGTSVGLTTAYMAVGNPQSKIYTIEGSTEIGKTANDVFRRLQMENIRLVHNTFDEALPNIWKDFEHFDLLYIDGNHTYEATLRYFYQALEHVQNNSVIIFDDIYWSEGMTKAWKEIAAHGKVTASVDAFEFGIVFFRKELSKQHFILKL